MLMTRMTLTLAMKSSLSTRVLGYWNSSRHTQGNKTNHQSTTRDAGEPGILQVMKKQIIVR